MPQKKLHWKTRKAIEIRAFKRYIDGETAHLAGWVTEAECLARCHLKAQEAWLGKIFDEQWAWTWGEWVDNYGGDDGGFPYNYKGV